MAESVLVFAEHQASSSNRPAMEAIAAGQQLAQQIGAGVSAVLLGQDVAPFASELAALELQEVLTVASPLLAAYTADGYAYALREVIQQQQPRFVVFSHTYLVRDFAAKLATSLERALVSDCLGFRAEGGGLIFVRQIFQGKFAAAVAFSGAPPYFVSFQASAFRADSARRGATPAPVTPFSTTLAVEHIRTRPGEPFREAKQAVDLSQAEIIVAVGRGIKAPENLDLARKLAEALGAELGASRPICDNGWLPMERQVGSSGQTVAPKLYVALGISGAIQHMVGMKGSNTVVAINKDKEAPIFEVATFGVVGDLFEIVPPLTEEIKKLKAS